MSQICKYCGRSLPDSATKCKYCAKALKAVKPAAKPTKTAEKPKATKVTKTANKNKAAEKPTATKKPLAKSTKDVKTGTKPTAKKPAAKPAAKPIAKKSETKSSKTKVAKSSLLSNYNDVFNAKDYLSAWKKFSKKGNAGIILTNTSGLSASSGVLEEIKKYCSARSDFANYTILDLNTIPAKGSFSSCEGIVALLNEIYTAAVPVYLMIVGDASVIPFMNWENYAGDDDRTVPSDLPYITLDTSSPWDGKEYSFVSATKVGRIPASPVNDFKNAVDYFKFAADYKPLTSVAPFAITAYQWINASKLVFGKMKCDILTSPDYTCNASYVASYGMRRLPDLSDRNLLGFNLHGSDATHYWYGQKGDSYPEAFDAASLPRSKSGYTVCVEACYGARPKVEAGKAQSIVVTALSNKCVAFVGSTRIAYGAVGSSMSCADVIANAFIDSVSSYKTSGEAFLDSLTALLKSGNDENVFKTLAEFALYGDPSITPFGGKKALTSASTSVKSAKVKTKTNSSKAIRLIPCDVATMKATGMFTAYSQEIKKAENDIKTVTATSASYIDKNFAQASKKAPKIFKVANANEYRTIYKTTIGKVKTYIKLHINGKGKVIKTYISK